MSIRDDARLFGWKTAIKWWLQTKWQNAIGFKLASWVDKRHPDWCWAEICLNLGMARGEGGILHWRDHVDATSCKKECAEMGTCWCGKFQTEDPQATWAEYLKRRDAVKEK